MGGTTTGTQKNLVRNDIKLYGDTKENKLKKCLS